MRVDEQLLCCLVSDAEYGVHCYAPAAMCFAATSGEVLFAKPSESTKDDCSEPLRCHTYSSTLNFEYLMHVLEVFLWRAFLRI